MKLKYGVIFSLVLILILSSCIPQDNEIPKDEEKTRYYDEIFSEVRVEKNIVYGESVDYTGKRIELKLDVYEPEGDSEDKRPLIIWIHGGGFKSGDKNNVKIVELCKYFAKRGYVTASINYRLRKRPKRDLEGAIKDAVEDARKSVDFFRENSDRFRIDVNHIAVGGSSAGAITSIHLAYTDGWNKEGIFAVISLWGALFDFDEIKQTDPPLLIIHGTEDRVVPFGMAKELKNKLDEIGIFNEFHPIEGEGHAPWRHLKDIETWTRDFLFKLLNSESSNTNEKTDLDIPYYFIAIHNEPFNMPGGEKRIEKSFSVLREMVKKANEYNIKLTLMFSPQWADYIVKDKERLTEVKRWEEEGHEIAAHHHSIYHGNWDGYTNYPEDVAKKERIKRKGFSEPYLGTLKDLISKLKMINPDIHSGCMNDEKDKNCLPDEIIYDTCSGFANFGEVIRVGDASDPKKGINEFVLVGKVNGIKRKWLAHYQITTRHREKLAENVFNSLDSGVYGVVTHSVESQAEYFYKFLDFLHSKDKTGEYSKTLSQIIDEKILPEREIPDELLNP